MNVSIVRSAGFTLIELLVVVSIIGLLSSVVLFALNSSRADARDVRRVADVKQIATALELYYNQCNSYPGSAGYKLSPVYQLFSGTNANCGTNFGDSSGNGGIFGGQGTGTVFMRFPSAPTPVDNPTGTTTCSEANVSGFSPATNNDYVYFGTSTSGSPIGTSPIPSFRLFFCLGQATGGYSAGLHVLSPSGIN